MTGEEGVIRVLVVDDHRVVREGLRGYFSLVDDIEVVGEAADGRAALDSLARAKAEGALPHVVLMDLLMEPMDGITATAAIKERYPDVEVVAVTSFVEEEKVHGAPAAGAAGYLLKDAEADEVAAAVRSANRGEVHLDPAVARRLTASLRRGPSASPKDLLTEREREILGLVAQGSSNKEIAATLVISERTARTHVSNILSKLDLSSRTQAALWAGARQAARNSAALGQTAAQLAGRSQLWEVFGEIARHAVEGTRAVACAIAAADDAGVLRAGGSVGVGEGFRQVALSGAMRIRDLPTPTSCSAAAPRSFPMPGSDGSSRNGRRSAPRSRTSSGRRACMSR